jgi:hypothetical protein
MHQINLKGKKQSFCEEKQEQKEKRKQKQVS